MKGLRGLARIFILTGLIISITFGNVHFAPAHAKNPPLISEDSLNVDLLQRASVDPRVRHPLDIFSLLQQEVVTTSDPFGFESVEVIAIDHNGVETIISPLTKEKLINHADGFEIHLKFQSRTFHKFYVDAISVARLGSYLVFVEKTNAQSDHQEIRFLDMNYFKEALGRTELPVFTITVDAGGPITSLQGQDDILLIKSGENVNRINERVLKEYSQMHQLLFNMSVALSDPREVDRIKHLLEDFSISFDRALELQGKSLSEQLENLATTQDRFRRQFKDMSQKVIQRPLQPEEANELWKIDQSVATIANQSKEQNRLMNRFRLLTESMALPKPLAAPSLVQALHHVAWGIQSGEARVENLKQSIRQLVHNKSLRRAAMLATVGASAIAFPVEASALIKGSLEISQSVFESILGKGSDLLRLAHEAGVVNATGFSKFFTDILFSSENFPKMMVGLTAMTGILYTFLGLPHVIVHSFYLWRDFRGKWGEFRRSEEGFFKSFKQSFIQRQRDVEAIYVDELSRAELQELGRLDQKFSEEDTVEARRLVEELDSKYQSTFSARVMNKIGLYKIVKLFETKGERNIETFGQALRHFLFSTAAITSSVKSYAWGWSQWHVIRSFVWRPAMFVTYLSYPEFFHRARRGENATILNGAATFRGVRTFRLLLTPEYHAAIEAWEDRIFEVEAKIQKEIMARALRATIRRAESIEEVQRSFKAGAPKKISDKRIEELSYRQKLFFRHYYDTHYEKSMTHFLRALAERSGQFSHGADSLSSLKAQLIGESERIKEINPNESIEAVSEWEVFELASKKANSAMSLESISTQAKYKMQNVLNGDNNMITKRMNVVEERLEKPKAVERAVRSMIAQNIIDKPIELMFTFLSFAAITEGLLAPVQQQMFGENSFFYLSRFLFLNAFTYGVISGVLADTWLKLQMDSFNDGKFNDVPNGKDANRGWFSWYFKKTFHNPDNSYVKSYKNTAKLIFWNMPAAFTQIFVLGLLTMGRMDLDLYLTAYIGLYMFPWGPMSTKLEQGFEFASSYFVKDVPERLRGHPLVQKYLSSQNMKKRLEFNLLFKPYENIEYNFRTVWTTMQSLTFGTRGFSRILNGGETFTAVAVNQIEKVKELGHSIPGVEKVANLCRKILTNQNLDWK